MEGGPLNSKFFYFVLGSDSTQNESELKNESSNSNNSNNNNNNNNNNGNYRILIAKKQVTSFAKLMELLNNKLAKKGYLDINNEKYWIASGNDLIDDEDTWEAFSEDSQMFNIIILSKSDSNNNNNNNDNNKKGSTLGDENDAENEDFYNKPKGIGHKYHETHESQLSFGSSSNNIYGNGSVASGNNNNMNGNANMNNNGNANENDHNRNMMSPSLSGVIIGPALPMQSSYDGIDLDAAKQASVSQEVMAVVKMRNRDNNNSNNNNNNNNKNENDMDDGRSVTLSGSDRSSSVSEKNVSPFGKAALRAVSIDEANIDYRKGQKNDKNRRKKNHSRMKSGELSIEAGAYTPPTQAEGPLPSETTTRPIYGTSIKQVQSSKNVFGLAGNNGHRNSENNKNNSNKKQAGKGKGRGRQHSGSTIKSNNSGLNIQLPTTVGLIQSTSLETGSDLECAENDYQNQNKRKNNNNNINLKHRYARRATLGHEPGTTPVDNIGDDDEDDEDSDDSDDNEDMYGSVNNGGGVSIWSDVENVRLDHHYSYNDIDDNDSSHNGDHNVISGMKTRGTAGAGAGAGGSGVNNNNNNNNNINVTKGGNGNTSGSDSDRMRKRFEKARKRKNRSVQNNRKNNIITLGGSNNNNNKNTLGASNDKNKLIGKRPRTRSRSVDGDMSPSLKEKIANEVKLHNNNNNNNNINHNNDNNNKNNKKKEVVTTLNDKNGKRKGSKNIGLRFRNKNKLKIETKKRFNKKWSDRMPSLKAVTTIKRLTSPLSVSHDESSSNNDGGASVAGGRSVSVFSNDRTPSLASALFGGFRKSSHEIDDNDMGDFSLANWGNNNMKYTSDHNNENNNNHNNNKSKNKHKKSDLNEDNIDEYTIDDILNIGKYRKTMISKKDGFETMNDFVLNEHLRTMIALYSTGKKSKNDGNNGGNKVLLNKLSNYFELKMRLSQKNFGNDNENGIKQLLLIKKEIIFDVLDYCNDIGIKSYQSRYKMVNLLLAKLNLTVKSEKELTKIQSLYSLVVDEKGNGLSLSMDDKDEKDDKDERYTPTPSGTKNGSIHQFVKNDGRGLKSPSGLKTTFSMTSGGDFSLSTINSDPADQHKKGYNKHNHNMENDIVEEEEEEDSTSELFGFNGNKGTRGERVLSNVTAGDDTDLNDNDELASTAGGAGGGGLAAAAAMNGRNGRNDVTRKPSACLSSGNDSDLFMIDENDEKKIVLNEEKSDSLLEMCGDGDSSNDGIKGLTNEMIFNRYINELNSIGIVTDDFTCDVCNRSYVGLMNRSKRNNMQDDNINVNLGQYGIRLSQCFHVTCKLCYLNIIYNSLKNDVRPMCIKNSCRMSFSLNDVIREFHSNLAHYMIDNLSNYCPGNFNGSMNSHYNLNIHKILNFYKNDSFNERYLVLKRKEENEKYEKQKQFGWTQDELPNMPQSLPTNWNAKFVSFKNDENKQIIVYVNPCDVNFNNNETITTIYPLRDEKVMNIINLVTDRHMNANNNGIPFDRLPSLYKELFYEDWNIQAWFNLASNYDIMKMVDLHFKEDLSYDANTRLVFIKTEKEQYMNEIEMSLKGYFDCENDLECGNCVSFDKDKRIVALKKRLIDTMALSRQKDELLEEKQMHYSNAQLDNNDSLGLTKNDNPLLSDNNHSSNNHNNGFNHDTMDVSQYHANMKSIWSYDNDSLNPSLKFIKEWGYDNLNSILTGKSQLYIRNKASIDDINKELSLWLNKNDDKKCERKSLRDSRFTNVRKSVALTGLKMYQSVTEWDYVISLMKLTKVDVANKNSNNNNNNNNNNVNDLISPKSRTNTIDFNDVEAPLSPSMHDDDKNKSSKHSNDLSDMFDEKELELLSSELYSFEQMECHDLDFQNSELATNETVYVRIVDIERIQNTTLFGKYMKTYSSDSNNNELYLWHGSMKIKPKRIWHSKNGFDASKCKFDHNLWFAKSASYTMSGFEYGYNTTKYNNMNENGNGNYFTEDEFDDHRHSGLRSKSLNKARRLSTKRKSIKSNKSSIASVHVSTPQKSDKSTQLRQVMLCLCSVNDKNNDQSYDNGQIYSMKNGNGVYPAYVVTYVLLTKEETNLLFHKKAVTTFRNFK